MGRAQHKCFAVCQPGLETLVADELFALGIKPGPIDRGGVPFRASTRELYSANLWLRSAQRILLRWAEFHTRSFAGLVASAEALDWAQWIGRDMPARFRVTSKQSDLYHTDAIAERLATAIGSPRQPEVDEPAQDFVVRLHKNILSISVDTSGDQLHRRGYRLDARKAPLRETYAAAMLLASGYDGSAAFIDPFCGAGTLPIEAAMIARNIPPGAYRDFAFTEWPGFEPGTWASVIGAAESSYNTDTIHPIVAWDRDAGAIEATVANAERAGVEDDIEVKVASFSDLTPPNGHDTGWIITDPPHGHRTEVAGELRNLYSGFGGVVKERFRDWRIGMLVSDRAMYVESGLRLTEHMMFESGGRPVIFMGPKKSAEQG